MGTPIRGSKVKTQLLQQTARVPDAKLGRISVPKKLLEAIGAEKEIIFCGNDYKIEIWAKDRYESEALSEQEYAALADMLSDLK